MLNFLSTNSQKITVGLSLTPGVGLEAVIYDNERKAVAKYGKRKVDYNFSTREIQDQVQFKTAAAELFDELEIPPKSLIYLALPNVYFDFLEVPPSMAEPEIKTILTSQSEEFYIFKREEPVVGWCDTINPDSAKARKLAFSPFPKTTIDNIKAIISDLGMQLIGLENSYSATLRGLKITGLLDDVIMKEAYWTAMLIGTNSYVLFNMYGRHILECNEVPLAIKSFSVEEAYQAIISSSSQLLANFPASRLYTISQTDEICANVLRRQMQFDRENIAIDSNKFSKKPLIEVLDAADTANANSLTLSAIGASLTKVSDFNMVMNTLYDDPEASTGVYFTTEILGQTVDVTSEFAQKVSIAVTILILIVCGVIAGLLALTNNKCIADADNAKSEISRVDAQILKETEGKKDQEIDMMALINEIAEQNVTAVNFYDSIATDIPKNVWLTKYFNKTGDKLAVQGIAENITDIYEYYKNLRIVSPQSNIKLTELKVVTSSDEISKDILIDTASDRLYSFEIGNTTIETKAQEQKPESDEGFTIIKKSGSNNNPGLLEQPSNQMKPAN